MVVAVPVFAIAIFFFAFWSSAAKPNSVIYGKVEIKTNCSYYDRSCDTNPKNYKVREVIATERGGRNSASYGSLLDSSGYYRIGVPAGPYTVSVRGPNKSSEATSQVEVFRNDGVELNFVVEIDKK